MSFILICYPGRIPVVDKIFKILGFSDIIPKSTSLHQKSYHLFTANIWELQSLTFTTHPGAAAYPSPLIWDNICPRGRACVNCPFRGHRLWFAGAGRDVQQDHFSTPRATYIPISADRKTPTDAAFLPKSGSSIQTLSGAASWTPVFEERKRNLFNQPPFPPSY